MLSNNDSVDVDNIDDGYAIVGDEKSVRVDNCKVLRIVVLSLLCGPFSNFQFRTDP